MLRTAGNLKQIVAVVAILLSLSTLAQNCGLYCILGACRAQAARSTADLERACTHCACHHHDQQPADSSEEPTGHQHDSCPCPEDCWCHLPPQPFELPKTVDAPLELAFLHSMAICDDLGVCNLADQPDSLRWSPPHVLDDESAVYRCAKLCRFLI